MRIIFLSSFLTNSAPFAGIHRYLMSIVLPGPRFVLKRISFDLIAETIFRASADRSGLVVLPGSWNLVLAAETASLRSAHFSSSQFELRIDIIIAWTRLRILNFAAVFRSHSKSRRVFVDRSALKIVVARTRSQSLSKGVDFRFRTHGYFGS